MDNVYIESPKTETDFIDQKQRGIASKINDIVKIQMKVQNSRLVERVNYTGIKRC